MSASRIAFVALHAAAAALAAAGLAGCADAPRVQAQTWAWHDAQFDWRPELVSVAPAELFRLDDELAARLRSLRTHNVPSAQKRKELLNMIFGSARDQFGYSAGHSTTASETWQRRKGDCLSLTVLTYSAARALGMQAQMQEVRVPPMFDRRGQYDAVNQHVNVVFKRAQRDVLDDSEPRDVVVDFEPDYASNKQGELLTEAGIVARYYNNVAAENLAAGRKQLSYAYFKAAIQSDPGYAASYGNLAVLYKQGGQAADAEQLLRVAISRGRPGDTAVYTLHQMLQEQGRTAEARALQAQLDQARDGDPYHWIAVGIKELDAGNARAAVEAFERARDMTSGFDEIHRYLAVAYWRAGDGVKARQEIDVLASAGDNAGASKLKSKFRKRPLQDFRVIEHQ